VNSNSTLAIPGSYGKLALPLFENVFFPLLPILSEKGHPLYPPVFYKKITMVGIFM
jgi:hypothetical protein